MEKGMAFVDKKCPDCDGRGYGYDADGKEQRCETCEGTGLIGSYEEVEIRKGEPDDFAKVFRKLREEANISMSEMADILGCSVVRMSELERGKGEPRTPEEKEMMRKWVSRNYPPGSDKALDKGCTCPVMENRHGKGLRGDEEEVWYVYSDDCPVHVWRY